MKRLQLVDVRHARGFIGKEPEPNQFLETAKHQSGHLVQIVLGMILQTPYIAYSGFKMNTLYLVNFI